MKVTNLWMRKTGTYRPIFSRPYRMSAVSESDVSVLADLQNATQGGVATDPVSLVNVASRIVAPSATMASAIPIANGLDTPRFYVFLECEVQVTASSRQLILFSGYTDYDGATQHGVIDPNMRLYLNNQVKLREMKQVTGRGLGTVLHSAGSNQILTNTSFDDYRAPLVTMRPEDMFSNAAFLETNIQPDAGSVDMRYTWKQAIKVNDRLNNHPAEYLSKVLSAQVSAENNMDYTGSDSNLYSLSRGYVAESTLSNDVVLTEMAQYSDLLQHGYITWGALAAMPGNEALDQRTTIDFGRPAQFNFDHHNTHEWHGADKETMSAYYMSTLLPPIMMKNMMVSYNFSITNDTPGGRVITQPGVFTGMRGVDLTAKMPAIMMEVANNIFNIITDEGQTLASMEVTCDVFNDITVRTAINGGPVTVHTLPCFCDSAAAPVISTGMDALNTLSKGLIQTLDYARHGIESSHQTERWSIQQNPFDTMGHTFNTPMSHNPFDTNI